MRTRVAFISPHHRVQWRPSPPVTCEVAREERRPAPSTCCSLCVSTYTHTHTHTERTYIDHVSASQTHRSDLFTQRCKSVYVTRDETTHTTEPPCVFIAESDDDGETDSPTCVVVECVPEAVDASPPRRFANVRSRAAAANCLAPTLCV